ncbi:FMN-binding protein [Gudongella sp. DL1XJH-153]|uniref:FMN-binding protein n=1 Tax=Gudongella sp. DL1XJH-153 TaxID=3409804 RepID=UPI003BB68F97
MLKSRGLSFIIIALISVAVLFVGNSMMDSGGGFADIPDGVYEGSSDAGMYPGLKVAVTFEGGNITNVEVVEHSETEGISDPAIEGVPAAIVASNSTEVDVVSGATLTSNAIIEAVNNAIAVASGNAPAVEYVDGTYEGTSDKGMNPGLKVSVTVEGGKIVSVEVIEHDETDGIADPAIEEVPAAIVEAGSPNVDVVSGATLTSDAIMDAVQNALSGDSGSEEPEEEEEAIEEPEIEFIVDGTYEGTSDAGMYEGLRVSVTVEGGKITNVEVIEHSETEGIADPAIEGIPAAIVEANSTVVDVVSGATYTSDAIMEATRLALLDAPTEVPQVEYIDGTYEGTSDAGMYEGLKVSVTVEGGVITNVEVVEHSETDGIADPAIEEVPVSIVKANSPAVDTVSGATLTSNAIIEAVELALEGAVAGADSAPEPAVSYTDGTYEGTSDAGMYEGLKVSVTVEGGVITNVEVVEHSETDGIADPAIEEVPAAIVAANSPAVDTVSGATYTSDAIIEAVELALEGAQ